MPTLRLYEDYSREAVHDIFAPDTTFTPQSGTWGLQGIVKIPDREGDFVFFVTFGQQQGEHVFDEGITRDGVLTWQSQPSQTRAHPVIRQLIGHDELRHSIYLFLRTARGRAYTYLGKLKYLSHDRDRERPVYFQWQILDWDPPAAALRRAGLVLSETPGEAIEATTPTQGGLTRVEAPAPRTERSGTGTRTFQARKSPDYADRDAKNRALGLAGEELVVAHERTALEAQNRPDLAARVRHVSVLEGDGAGYDVQSWTPAGAVKYIEVKTTRGGPETPFYLSSAELAFSQEHAERYYLYRVFGYDATLRAGEFFVLEGRLDNACALEPTQYRVRLETP